MKRTRLVTSYAEQTGEVTCAPAATALAVGFRQQPDSPAKPAETLAARLALRTWGDLGLRAAQ